MLQNQEPQKEEPKKEEPKIEVRKPSEKVSVLARLVPPHTKKSRVVISSDVKRVVKEVKILHAICFEPYGLYKAAHAMHHSQIDDKDPLDFFVTFDRQIVINPKITRHSNYFVDSEEGCTTFPDKEQIIVPRWRKVEVDYLTIMVDPNDENKFKLSSMRHVDLKGRDAWVLQHEVDHGQAKYIYPFNK